jgi:hypothetical protein
MKILLTILPYWAPVLPPVGLARLKSFLQANGYEVKIVDLIVKNETLEFYYGYFDVLKKCVPEKKQGNFKNLGHDVLQNHMMAHMNYRHETEYIELVKTLIYKTYYVDVHDSYARELNKVVAHYFEILEEYFLFLLDFEKPEVVGATVYKGTLPVSLFVLKLTRRKYPHIKTIIGGGAFAESHSVDSPNFEKLLETSKDYIDKIIIGEGELLFLKYLRGELPDSKRVYTRNDIGGMTLDFNAIHIPDLSDLNLRKYAYLPATASIGCPFQCSFCNDFKFWGKYRRRDTRKVVDEMVKLYETVELNNVNSGHQLFFFTDSLLNLSISELAKEIIRRNVSLYYDGYYKVDNASTDVENTFLWRKSGLYRVRLGVESGSQHVLNLMNKGITVEQIRESVTGFALAGVKTTTYWVIGHPGETEEDFRMTLDLVAELKNDIYQSECNPFLYYYSGQNSADQWQVKRMLLYPENARKMLVFDSWTLAIEPIREVAYERMHRFVEHCQKLGIPNPYSFKQIFDADLRWKRLHKFAVPALDEFGGSGKYLRDNLNERTFAKRVSRCDGDFNF